MVEKVSQADSNNSGLPNVPAVAPTSDTPYIQPVIGKLGYDTKHPEIFGLGSSPDNGASFHVWASFGGIVLDKDNMDAIWINGVSDRVKSEVNSATAEIPAVKSAADEAVKKADSAIASSKVNSDAIVAQSEAISEAKAAMERATAEIQQTASNAASDAAKIRADVAQVQNEVDTAKAANSASVEALKSDIDTAKQDLANVHDSLTKAQSAVEQNQKLINDSVAKISNDIAQDRKGLATAQQNNADLAKQLDDYSKQAEAQGETIKSIQDKQDSFTATLADVQGNVSQVSDKVDGLSASLKDAQDNVATVKAQADQLNATLTDHAKSIATLTASAKELSSTLEDADGRLNKVEQTAQTNSSTLSDVQGDLSQVKQQADGLVSTLKDAQGNIDQLQQAAKGTAEQISDVQGDITNLQKDVNGIKLTIADHDKNIHTLQADSKSLQDDMADAKGNISSLQKTSTDLTSEVQDHSGRLSKVEQTASTLTNELSDEQGHLNRVEQTAQGTQQTVANQQGQINTIKTDAAGIHETLTGQGNQIANINVTLNGLSSKYEGVSGDLGKLKSSTMQNRGTVNAPDFNTLTQAGYYTVTNPISGKNYSISNWGTLEVSGQTVDGNGRLNQKYVGDNDSGTYTRQYNANTKSWTAWIKTANQNDVTALSNRITTNSTQITQNQQAIALKADQATVNNLSGEVSQAQAQLKVQAGEISSKVSSSDFKTLNDKFNNMQIGGRNLLTNTDKDISVTSHTTDGWPAWANIDTGFSFGHGKTYTFSAEAKNSTNKIAEASIRVFEGSTNTQVGIYAFPADGKRHSVTFTIPNDSHDYHLLLYAGHAGIVPGVDVTTTYHHQKLEFGNVATDWTPAPEDTITAIQKNSTAIDQTNKQISLKADQTEVDKVKGTASQNSSRIDTMANEISSKVTSTDVNNIVDKKGYATTSTVQSLITQKAGTISESITNLEQTVKQGVENNVQLVRKSEFEDGSKGSWNAQMIVSATNPAPPAELGQSGMKVLQSNTRDANEVDVWYSVKPGEKFDVDFWCAPSTVYNSNFGLVFVDKNKGNSNWLGIVTDHSGAWKHYTGTIAAPTNAAFARPWFQIDKDSSDTSNTAWLAKPSIRRQNAITVAAIQQITASIDGLQSTVTNKADKSQITQLSNLIQSKVSSNDFTSKISQLSNDINARVSKGDLMSQINIEAGRALFQSKKLFLDADSVVFSGKAFIPSAAITSLEADKITTGTLNGVHIHQIANANGRSIDMANGNISLNSSDPYESRISFTNNGKDAKMFNAVGDIEVLNQEFALFNFTPEDTHSLNPIPFFKVTNTGQIGSGGAQLNMDHAIFDGYEWWTPSAGVTFGRTWNGVDKSSDYADIYAKSFVPHSELSAKTRIKKLDRKEALDKIMQDDMYTYQFKEDVRDGVSKRYASFIIDNIHDVAQYTEPEEFLSANGKGRDDGTQLAYLIAAVQYQQEQIEELKKKLEEK